MSLNSRLLRNVFPRILAWSAAECKFYCTKRVSTFRNDFYVNSSTDCTFTQQLQSCNLISFLCSFQIFHATRTFTAMREMWISKSSDCKTVLLLIDYEVKSILKPNLQQTFWKRGKGKKTEKFLMWMPVWNSCSMSVSSLKKYLKFYHIDIKWIGKWDELFAIDWAVEVQPEVCFVVEKSLKTFSLIVWEAFKHKLKQERTCHQDSNFSFVDNK